MAIRKTLSRLTLAFALMASFVAAGAAFQPAVASESLSNKRLSAPVYDAGDPDIRDMPVVGR